MSGLKKFAGEQRPGTSHFTAIDNVERMLVRLLTLARALLPIQFDRELRTSPYAARCQSQKRTRV